MRKILILLFSILLLSGCSLNTLSTESTASPPVIGKPKNITLLVPLEGANGTSGQAIRNGFLAAYYYAKQNMSDAPAINVVDSNSGNISALYQEAVAKGADFVVGPLIKQHVQTLATQADPLTVPVLALNSTDAKKTVNLYQFGLSPLDEAEQVATHAKQANLSSAVIITPAGNWGNDVANAFATQWQKLGGSVTYRLAYPSRGDMTLMVQKALKNGTANPDMVFLVASNGYARQIKPLISFYGRSLPIYATSLVYSGTPSKQDNDLDGIIFNDMPWIIGNDTAALSQIRSHIQTLWSDSYNHSPRLYALGIDAYNLTATFDQLSSGVDGASGRLTLDANQRVRRSLDWAKFKAGVPQKIE